VRQAFADLFAQFPDLAFERVSLRTGSDFWVAEWRVSGTLAGTDAKAMPDLHGELKRWAETADGVLIELTLSGHLGRRPLEWTVVDRIILEDGLIRERRSYFDPAPLLKAVALQPRASLPLLLRLFRQRG
jgi:hypothetical protein